MSNILRGGFRPAQGWPVKPARRYEVASAYGTAIFPGDVVTLVTAGTVEVCTAGGAPLILGVVSRCSYVGAEGKRIETYVPAGTTYTPTTRGSVNSTYVWVWDDPQIIYEACLASNAGTDTEAKIRAAIGSNMDIVATAGNATYFQSGHTLDGNPIAGTAQFRIIDVVRDPANDLTSANARVLCQINEGFGVLESPAGI